MAGNYVNLSVRVEISVDIIEDHVAWDIADKAIAESIESNSRVTLEVVMFFKGNGISAIGHSVIVPGHSAIYGRMIELVVNELAKIIGHNDIISAGDGIYRSS